MTQTGRSSARRQILVDRKVQGALVTRVALYWVMCLMTVGLMVLCWRILTNPLGSFYAHWNDLWRLFGPAAIASFLLLPLVMLDVVRLSNRFVGPIVRLRRAMRQLARGQDVRPIEFREGDFWQEFAAEFNAVAARVQGPPALLPPEAEGEGEGRQQEDMIVLGSE